MEFYVFYYREQNSYVAMDGSVPGDGYKYVLSPHNAMQFSSSDNINTYIRNQAPPWLRDMLSKGTMTLKPFFKE